MEKDFTVYTNTLVYLSTKYKYNIIQSPFGNCQMFGIKLACKILENLDNDEDVLKEFQSASQTAIGKKLCVIDIQHHYGERIDAIFKENVVSKTPYKSSNGSDMIMYILRVKKDVYKKD